MDFREFFLKISDLLSVKLYDEAFDLALNETQTFTDQEMDAFFKSKQLSKCCYGISGSGGSGINKPNIGTLAAYHISNIMKADGLDACIVKFGSRKKTSLSGSIDFGECISHKNFVLINDENFIEVIKYMLLNPDANTFLSENYISSKYVNKKIVFCKNQNQIESILKKNINTDIKLICSTLAGREIDEIIPKMYYVYEKGKKQKKIFPSKYKEDQYVLTDEEILFWNIRLLLGNFSGSWGEVLKFTLAEILSFFLEVTFENAFDIVENYEKNLKTLIVFDLDGSLLDDHGLLTNATIDMLKKIENFGDLCVNSGARLTSVIKKVKEYEFSYYMANYGSVLVGDRVWEQFNFSSELVYSLLSKCNYEDVELIYDLDCEDRMDKVQKIILYTDNIAQLNAFDQVSYFVYDKYVEIVPKGSKARPLKFLKEHFGYNNIVAIGNDHNDEEMFQFSDLFFVIDNYKTKCSNFHMKILEPHKNKWKVFENYMHSIFERRE